ncbi:glycosyltransferase family 2 protein [Salinivibrio proteolyticus]|uniref:Glycosyltransferase family 2 protein n=1 Tax=Salinivibrio proteolyticus TaxID=334715 RepID=A0ABY7LA49_9GAMM|nr:glycosyltransferase family 2 protein [Salinivibrio proteolyticus]WBA13948.1 glycosyltransferase family 2 protein [Salinivibrio proteolyticus]
MKVTIITATFNSENTIKDTLASLDSQDYPDIEYIVIDGGSTDNTVQLVKNQSKRLTKIVSEPDQGIYDALNKGIALATGDIIGFLHSDDILAYPTAISDVITQFLRHDADAVYADLDYVETDNVARVVRRWRSGEYKRAKLTKGWMPPHPTFYMKRSLYRTYGGFDLSYRIAADYESMLRYLFVNHVKAVYLPKVTIKMRLGGISNRSLKSVLKKTQEDIKALKANRIVWPFALIWKNISKIPQFF